MIICPYCDAENIEGVDNCASCESSLADLHLPTPASKVEVQLLRDRVNVLNPKTPISVQADMKVGEVLKVLVEKQIGSVLVNDGEKLVGIFSERDALYKLNVDAAELADRPISDFMTKDPQTLSGNEKVAFAVQRMDLGSFRHVPITTEDDVATGIISARDIMKYLTEQMTAASQ